MTLLSIDQVAELKGVTKNAVYLAMRQGIIKPYDHLTRAREALVVFEEDQVTQYLRRKAGRPKKNGHKL